MGLSDGEVYFCWGVDSMMLRRSCSHCMAEQKGEKVNQHLSQQSVVLYE